MEKEYLKFIQGEITLYSISLSISDLINATTVDYYNSKTGEGYQRPLVPAHYRKIAYYLQKSNNPVLPTAILTAVDPEQLEERRTLQISGKLRVVDGQHRIEGIRYLMEIDKEAFDKISHYTFPALVMVIPAEKRIHEINAFININKAGKPVSTDLAVELRDKIRKQNFDATKENLIEAIATRVTQDLNKRKESVWFNLIRLGDEDAKGKSISINAFHQSIQAIVYNYMYKKEVNIEKAEDVDGLVEEITLLLINSWKAVAKKWKPCFNYEPLVNIKMYNIQKGIGVFSLHMVLEKLILESDTERNKLLLSDVVVNKFETLLDKSQVLEEDWLIGGRFSTYNSKSGFSLISELISNQKNIDRKM
ncbi:DGQHR domain-containing protein [Paenibacillus sp. NRS-1760]|uniref:DGQHR domain-containing protein n=1 Tax=Paenibacillus sp. NRS-1760 TaxID=3233902 RepID=UPI003D27C71E